MNGVDNSLQERRWNGARHRDRNEARFLLRERMSELCSTNTTINIQGDDTEESQTDEIRDKIRSFFNSISIGSASSFSLNNISQNYDMLTLPHAKGFMSSYKINTLCTSRFGKSYADAVLDYKEKIKICTMIEYASLIGEYGVVSSLLAGGVNPFPSYPMDNERKLKVSRLVIKKLVADLVPTSLASFAIKCVYDMKMWSLTKNGSTEETCNLCNSDLGQILLTFPSCRHKCCESCMWESTAQNLQEIDEGNIVKCPQCGTDHEKRLDVESVAEPSLSPAQKGEESRNLFNSLPVDGRELKQRPKRAKAKNIIHSSWQSALLPKIGSSQDVRKDKFNRYVSLGAIHHCRACLRSGIDVNSTNEYNQTPLYIASWRNQINVVQLLLEYGADLNLQANGGMTAYNVAVANCNATIANMLSNRSPVQYLPIRKRISINEDSAQSFESKITTLISTNDDHPGAGSYLIDNVIPIYLQNFLDELWSQLPIAAASDVKKKKNALNVPCSKRYYFCDSEGNFCKVFAEFISSSFNRDTHGHGSSRRVDVFPHMRFLNYTDAGSALSPHVDLCKIDNKSGRRSTHTFILYLRDCVEGGETALLRNLHPSTEVITKVFPRKGRLLLFPHACPHEGGKVISTPKLLLRGEVMIQ